MNDEPDLELEAASAAVDGLATSDERALVQSSPALQADVEAFAGLRRRIADVTVPSAARESAVRAALAAFDEAVAPTAAAAAASRGSEPDGRSMRRGREVVSLDSRRRRQYRALLGAAAAVVVLAVGAVIVNDRDGEGDDDVSTEAAASPTTVVVAGPAPLITGSTAAGGSPERTAEPAADQEADDATAASATASEAAGSLEINESAAVAPAISTPQQLLSFATNPTGDALDTAAPPDVPATALPSLPAAAPGATTTDADASDTTSTAQPSPSAKGPDPAASCVTADSEYVGLVRYQGTLAHVVRILATGEVRALSTTDCALLAFAEP